MDSPEQIPEIVPIYGGGPAQNFGLHLQEFNEMIALLRSGDDSLFEHIFLTHFEDCRTYISKKYDISHEISYDTTMDTLLEFRLKLIQGKISYGNTRYLFTRMACNNFVVTTRKDHKIKDVLIAEDVTEDVFEEQIQKLETAWKRLEDDEKSLLSNYYYDGVSLKDIAETLNIPDATLRKKKQRAMDHLRNIFFSITQH